MITSQELNTLVYRYLLESGYSHTAYTFAHESLLAAAAPSATVDLAPGALVSFLHRGLLFTQLEREVDETAGVVQPLVKRSKSTAGTLSSSISSSSSSSSSSTTSSLIQLLEGVTLVKPSTSEVFGVSWNPMESFVLASVAADSNAYLYNFAPPSSSAADHPNTSSNGLNGSTSGETSSSSSSSHHATPKSGVVTLPHVPPREGDNEKYDVTSLCWSPDGKTLATSCADGVTRLFDLDGKLVAQLYRNASPLFAVRWSPDGRFLLTAAHDGSVTLWSAEHRRLIHVWEKSHSSHVLDVDWCPSPSPNPVASSSSSSTPAAVMVEITTASGEEETKKETTESSQSPTPPNSSSQHHPALIFASCSSDRTLVVYALEDPAALASLLDGSSSPSSPLPFKSHTLSGHVGEVNRVRFSHDGTMLASASDDWTARVWRNPFRAPATSPVLLNDSHELLGHTKEVHAVEWSPTGPGAANEDKPRRLATAALDWTVRLWDLSGGVPVLTHVLARHADAVYGICFSPMGDMLCTASQDKFALLWRVEDGALLKSIQAKEGIFDVAWSSSSRLAAGAADGSVLVVQW